MGQVQPVESPRQQGEPEERPGGSQAFRGEEVQVPGHRLVEQVPDPLQLQTGEPAAEQPPVLALQPAHTPVVKATTTGNGAAGGSTAPLKSYLNMSPSSKTSGLTST